MTLARNVFAIAAVCICTTALAQAQDSAGNFCSQFAGTPHTLPSPEVVEGATASHIFKSIDETRLRIHVFSHLRWQQCRDPSSSSSLVVAG